MPKCRQVATTFGVESFNGEQLAGAVGQTVPDGIFNALLDRIPNRARLALAEGEVKGFVVGAQGDSISQPHLQRAPNPQQQISGCTQLTASTFQEQSEQRMLWGWIQKRFHHLQIASDLTQSTQ